jgi:predicted GNAT family acetyltransferase
MTQFSPPDSEAFTPDVTLRRNDKLHRYELLVGGELAVQTRYLDRPGHIDFQHTDTAERFRGRGLAKVLAHFALDDVLASGKRIIPHCPFIAAYLRRHPDYELDIDWPPDPPTGEPGNE